MDSNVLFFFHLIPPFHTFIPSYSLIFLGFDHFDLKYLTHLNAYSYIVLGMVHVHLFSACTGYICPIYWSEFLTESTVQYRGQDVHVHCVYIYMALLLHVYKSYIINRQWVILQYNLNLSQDQFNTISTRTCPLCLTCVHITTCTCTLLAMSTLQCQTIFKYSIKYNVLSWGQPCIYVSYLMHRCTFLSTLHIYCKTAVNSVE